MTDPAKALSHEVECRWSCDITVECPDCNEYFDYLASDHYSDGGFESLGQVAEKCQIVGVPCPNCGASLNIKIQDGL